MAETGIPYSLANLTKGDDMKQVVYRCDLCGKACEHSKMNMEVTFLGSNKAMDYCDKCYNEIQAMYDEVRKKYYELQKAEHERIAVIATTPRMG